MNMQLSIALVAVTLVTIFVSACGDTAKLADDQSLGPGRPVLPAADPPWIPTLNIATPDRWTEVGRPATLPSLKVRRMAGGLKHPRSLLVLPNGDVLVAESDTPAENDCGSSLRGWIGNWLMRSAGASGPSADRLTLLRYDAGGSAMRVYADFLTGLKSPFGIALVGNDLYVANTDALMKYRYEPGQTRIDRAGVRVRDLPAGCVNYHWTKNLLASRDGGRLYVSVGSNSDHGERGPELESGRAAIWELEIPSGRWRRYASGLRNPNGLAWEPRTGALWSAVNERDEMGSDLVPDYMTSVQDGSSFGWPCRYYGDRIDTRVPATWSCDAQRSSTPDYALGNHTASLGIVFATGAWKEPFGEGAFVAQHGSWNRRPWSGYKVIFVPFSAGKPAGPPMDVLWGFREGDAAHGRPVSVAIDRDGALLVADDVGNSVWRVEPR